MKISSRQIRKHETFLNVYGVSYWLVNSSGNIKVLDPAKVVKLSNSNTKSRLKGWGKDER